MIDLEGESANISFLQIPPTSTYNLREVFARFATKSPTYAIYSIYRRKQRRRNKTNFVDLTFF